MVASPAFDQSLVGAILSRRFRLTHELGRGGMGSVYAADPVDGGPPVAIKILHPQFIGDIPVLQRFLEEGRTCMRLVHPNILRVYECNTAEDGSSYLVMDLLEGVPLSAYTRNGGRVSLAHSVPILLGMLAGLEAAHGKGVVHRDLKPGNVFLARQAEGLYSVKLLDFGIAKVMDVAGGMGNKTKTGMLLGTPAYMSPEQIKSAKDVDGRADLWSAGVMFYEMLTGRTAFPAPTEYARLSAVLQTDPEPIAAIDAALAPLEPFLALALQKEPAARFQSAREMAMAVRGFAPAPPGEPPSRVVVAPLSRLPDRAWVDAGAAARTDPSHAHMVTTKGELPTRPLAAIAASGGSLAAGHYPDPSVDEQAVTHFEPVPPQSSTLASLGLAAGATPVGTFSARAAVISVPPAADRMAPGASTRRGVRPITVVLLVMLALGAGFAMGFAFAQMT